MIGAGSPFPAASVHEQRRARAARRAQSSGGRRCGRLPCGARSRGPAAQLAPRPLRVRCAQTCRRESEERGALRARATRPALLGASNSPAGPPEHAFAHRPALRWKRTNVGRGGRHAVAAICGAPRSAAGRGAVPPKRTRGLSPFWRPRSSSIAGDPARRAGRGTMSRSRVPPAARHDNRCNVRRAIPSSFAHELGMTTRPSCVTTSPPCPHETPDGPRFC